MIEVAELTSSIAEMKAAASEVAVVRLGWKVANIVSGPFLRDPRLGLPHIQCRDRANSKKSCVYNDRTNRGGRTAQARPQRLGQFAN